MKPADLQDIVIMQDTTTLAFEKLLESFNGETHALSLSFSSWQKTDKTFSITYLKYSN